MLAKLGRINKSDHRIMKSVLIHFLDLVLYGLLVFRMVFDLGEKRFMYVFKSSTDLSSGVDDGSLWLVI